MHGFDQWLTEGAVSEIRVPNIEHAIQNYRSMMPKVRSFTVLQGHLAKAGVGLDARMIDPNRLKPGQMDFDFDKIRNFMNTTNPTLNLPLLISKDEHVVDGHHRWIAAANNNVPVLAHCIDMVFHDLIDFLNKMQYPSNGDVE